MDCPTAADIARAHALLGSAEGLIAQRRAVYRAVVELCTDGAAGPVADDVVDHPMTRAHLGAVLGGTADYDAARLSDLAGAGAPVRVDRHRLRVADSAEAARLLAPALSRVAGELDRHGAAPDGLTVLGTTDVGFAAARAHLVRGLRDVVRFAPELAAALVPHIAVVALLDPRGSRRLGSASAREYPGLIMLPAPSCAWAAAEAVVHEGAHVAMFDFMITRSILDPRAAAPRFPPTWRSTSWPLEQAVAAFHAYTCLAALYGAAAPDPARLPAESLMPVAAGRAREIGEWLAVHARLLGADARRLLAALLGRDGLPGGGSEQDRVDIPAGSEAFSRRVGDRVLVAVRGPRPYLAWRTDPPVRGSVSGV